MNNNTLNDGKRFVIIVLLHNKERITRKNTHKEIPCIMYRRSLNRHGN